MAISTIRKVEGDEKVHHRAPAGKPKGSAYPQPPMTPMIDVTFQLLLFFILTCEFRETEGAIPGTLAGGPEPGITLPDPIQIRLMPSADRQSASYQLTGVATVITSVRELGNLLQVRQEQLGSREVPVVIFPNPDVPWGFVVEAFNQAKRARFSKIGFARGVM
jgi:biopolymer transport protein ExbD